MVHIKLVLVAEKYKLQIEIFLSLQVNRIGFIDSLFAALQLGKKLSRDTTKHMLNLTAQTTHLCCAERHTFDRDWFDTWWRRCARGTSATNFHRFVTLPWSSVHTDPARSTHRPKRRKIYAQWSAYPSRPDSAEFRRLLRKRLGFGLGFWTRSRSAERRSYPWSVKLFLSLVAHRLICASDCAESPPVHPQPSTLIHTHTN